ncbi:uncharacterized protein LOC131613143 [Vicia villosa]|uniref:uncharacterized protein LOC131613143 n=1 Tax=Vicia villosa TaxID=3911 RepID=UPI00273B973C|nr:uncharacterized protein LOC131613143 [Vicia villosa]
MCIRVVDLWVVIEKNGDKHLEAVIQDGQGDKIHVITRSRDFPDWVEAVKEHETYNLYNGEPVENDVPLKVCCNPLKLIFNGGTTMTKVAIPEIPAHKFSFFPIEKFLKGDYKHNMLYDIFFHPFMDPVDPIGSAKKARARRSLLLRDLRSKRQKYCGPQQLHGDRMMNTPVSITPRQPLNELTPSLRNSYAVNPSGKQPMILTPRDAGSEPSISRHAFRTNLSTYQIGGLGTNLFSKFAGISAEKENESFTPSSLVNLKERSPSHEMEVLRTGCSSNVHTCPPSSRPRRGRPKNGYGVPNIARNLTRKFPDLASTNTATPASTLDGNEQTSNPALYTLNGRDANANFVLSTQPVQISSDLNNASSSGRKPRSTPIPKRSRGRPRKQLSEIPCPPSNFNRPFTFQSIGVASSKANDQPNTSYVNTPLVTPLQIPSVRNQPVCREVPPLTQSTHTHHCSSEPTCPIFTPTVNMDFNSDSDQDSDYDPFAAYHSEDEICSDTDEHEAPFTIHGYVTGIEDEYYDIGSPLIECRYCKAMMWYQERMHKSTHSANPKFMMCRGNGKVELPLLRQPPEPLATLQFDHESIVSRKFQQQIRLYNMMFAFTSPGARLDNRFNNGRGPPILRIQGQTCHRIGSMLPPQGSKPKFAQLYIYDTENEVENRMHHLRNKENIDPLVVNQLSNMLYEYNPHAKIFQMARQWLNSGEPQNLKLRLISNRSTDGRVYNQPTVSEVAALVIGDIDTAEMRDIIMQTRGGGLQRINELHASYMAYQYPLIFPYGEDGYGPDVAHRRLFQQFLVDGYTMLESEKLEWLHKNQPKLRVSKYNSLHQEGDQSQAPGLSIGKRVVLPSSFVGGRRFMDQLYYDGMAICSKVGFPDLFITFTCNPNWPEIQRVLGPLHLNPQDRPDIISRVFKIKFDQLLSDLTKKGVLGKVLALKLTLASRFIVDMYTIEFQKRGLPHAHILIFLHPSNKYPRPEDIDKIISAEVPDPETQPRLYNLVKAHMVHGPCGLANLKSPCMKDGRCTKFYPKKFQSTTIVDQEGYPVYRRRNNGHTIQKKDIIFHSGHVVPHNPSLLLKYEAHINMEWCNQNTSIKYLFKYINKGSDRISAIIQGQDKNNVDEIKQYLDCRYISPSEACWRIFSYTIHGRKPAVERLFFHMEGENSVYYKDYEQVGDVLLKPSVTESMFTAWFEANKIYEEARLLTYGDFVSKFVYHKRSRSWKPRKRGYTIGRLI